MLLALFRMFIFIIIFNMFSISHANDKTATTILLFGDSIIAGYGLSKEDSLSVRVEKSLKESGYDVDVINGGVSGDTTSSGRSRLEWTLQKYKPDIVLLALGGNDVLRGFLPDITKQNLDAMLAILKKHNVKVILSEVQAPLNLGLEYKQEFDVIYSNLAKKYNVPLHPFLLENTFGKKIFMQGDQVHPNAEGINIIAKDLSRYLEVYIKNKASLKQARPY